MPKPRNRVNKKCQHCGKEFQVIKSREKTARFCSPACTARHYQAYENPNRKYPKKIGECEYCGKDIIAKNSSFDKPGRKCCSQSCATALKNKNLVWTDEMREKNAMNASKRFKGVKKSDQHRKNMRLANLGEKSHFWQGGKTGETRLARNSMAYKDWRTAVYERDNYTCQECGARNGKGKTVYLNADHIKPFSTHPELRYEVSNGKTLCLECHKMTSTFGSKSVKKTEVYQYTIQGDLVDIHESLSSASESTGVSRSSINNCMSRRSKTAGGFVWRHPPKEL